MGAAKNSPAVVRLGIAELERRLAVHRATIWRWWRAGMLPAPEYLGERRVWRLDVIEQWETTRLARSARTRVGARNLSRESDRDEA